MTLKRLLIAAILITVLLAGINGYLGLHALGKVNGVVNRVANDEHQTCLIQSRGLPAGHQLAASMNDIHILLTLPRQPNAPPVPPSVAKVVADLNQHLSLYQQMEGGQPARRVC